VKEDQQVQLGPKDESQKVEWIGIDWQAATLAITMGLMGLGMTCMYADPWSYGTPDSNFDNQDLIFPFAIAAYIYYHRHGSYMKNKETPTFTSDTQENFVEREAAALEVKDIVRGTAEDTQFKEGSITVIIFWAAWCSASKKVFAAIDRLNQKYKAKGVTFVALSQDSAKDVKNTLRNFKEPCDFCFATESGENTKNYLVEYKLNNIPHAFIVGKEGKVIWHGHPTALDRILHVNTQPKVEQQEGSDGDWEKVSETSEGD